MQIENPPRTFPRGRVSIPADESWLNPTPTPLDLRPLPHLKRLTHDLRRSQDAPPAEAGATFEYRVAKKPGSSQLYLFSGDDLASAPKLKGGVKLEKHYDQLIYLCPIVPKRPPFAILCNFDELWIYDFNEHLFDPGRLPKRFIFEILPG